MSMLFVTILVDLTLAHVNLDILAMAKTALVSYFQLTKNVSDRNLLPLAKVVLVSYFHYRDFQKEPPTQGEGGYIFP